MALFGRYLAASALLLAAPALDAQTPAPATTAAKTPTCDVSDKAKGATARATLSVDLARQAGPGPVAMNNLKTAVKLLETSEKGEDAVARAYVLGSALSLWMNQPGVGFTPTRGTVGFTGSPDSPLDLVGNIDSLFRIVETAKPLCGEYTAYWRAGQKAYLDVVNGAINAMNDDKLDSAESYARIANRLYSRSPYGSMVLGNVASKRKDSAKAIEYWTVAAASAERDSSYRDVRRQMLANIGAAYLAQASTGAGAAKITAARQAAQAYEQLLAVPGTTGSYMYAGRQQLQNALLVAGDTAAFVRSYQVLLEHADKYEYQDLLNSAVGAFRLNRLADAARLFESTLAVNPYSRDALFNLAVTYLSLEQNDKVAPLVTRLVALDPGNPENFRLAARAYLALGKAKKGSAASSLNDSTLAWFVRGNKLPVEVSFTEFTPGEKTAVIGGTVKDRRLESAENEPLASPTAKGKAVKASARSYPPMPVILTFEALDKAGTVLGSATVTTEALTPGKSARFTVTVPSVMATGYRYRLGS
ncbi:MAG: hypothetical protein H0W68_03560 [Gemmatimonadaceae bacterium]|nr:hypothetical protein [Gemmatimonadaceae bacterium]